jgi:hypothetical protein
MKTTSKLLAVGGLSLGIIAAPLVAANAAETPTQSPLIDSVVSAGQNAPLGNQGRALTAQIDANTATIGGTVAAGTRAVDLTADGRTLCTDTDLVRSGNALHFSCDVTVPLGVTQIDAVAGGAYGQRPLLLTSTKVDAGASAKAPGVTVLLAQGGYAQVVVTGAADGRYTLTHSSGADYRGQLDGNGEADLSVPVGDYRLVVDSTRQGGGIETANVVVSDAASASRSAASTVAETSSKSKHELSAATIAEQYQGAALVKFTGERLVTVIGEATNGQSVYTFTGATGSVTKQIPSGDWTFTFYDFEGHPSDGAPVVVHLDIPQR